MKLSEQLKQWRAERPDERTMDRFIHEAEKLESLLFEASEQIYDQAELEQKIQDALD